MPEKLSVKYSLSAPKKYIRRQRHEKDPGKYRNQFQRDRDRVLYSKEFRRLSGKTQVFLSLTSDHVRNRLTHTLEVAQIAQVTCLNLKLDINLCEAIALAHDVGHTPFGHVGERTLNEIMNGCYRLIDQQGNFTDEDKGFKHNLQGLRVTNELETLYENVGLNLSNFTMWGIKNHSSSTYPECESLFKGKCYLDRNLKTCNNNGKLSTSFYNIYDNILRQKDSVNEAWSFEAKVVAFSDEIAQRHHDIEDAFFMNIIEPAEFIDITKNFFNDFLKYEDKRLLEKIANSKDDRSVFLPYVSKFIVNFFNRELIDNSIKNLNKFIDKKPIIGKNHFNEIYNEIELSEIKNIIGYEKEFANKEKDFKEFLKEKIFSSFEVQRMDGKGRYIIRRLFKAYLTNPNQLKDDTLGFVYRIYKGEREKRPERSPSKVSKIREAICNAEIKSDPRFQISLLRGICDHIAGMTDRYAFSEYSELFES